MKAIHNEGSPLVFVGKLTTSSGEPVTGATITITHDGTCENKTIGSIKTDKTGEFRLYTSAKIWDKKDNMIKAQAKFTGKNGFLPSSSIPRIIVVYPLKNLGC
jgi:uncharacterized GH25 family protein